MERFPSVPARIQSLALRSDRLRLHVLDMLTRSVDYETTLQHVARVAVPQLADWASVYAPGDGQALASRIVVAHRDAGREAILAQVWPQRSDDLVVCHPHLETLQTCAPSIVQGEAAERVLAWSCPDMTREGLARLGSPHTIVTVPLVAHGCLQGSLMLGMNRQRGRAAEQ